MAALDVTQKTEIYHTLYQLNAAFSEVVSNCRKLQQTGLFKSKASKLLPDFAQELQAECNQEFSKTCTSSSLTIGDVTEKYGKHGTRNWLTPTTFSFMLKNAERNSQENARNAD